MLTPEDSGQRKASLESRLSAHTHSRVAELMPFAGAAPFFISVAFPVIHQVTLKNTLLAGCSA